jgi:hypothetical protein
MGTSSGRRLLWLAMGSLFFLRQCGTGSRLRGSFLSCVHVALAPVPALVGLVVLAVLGFVLLLLLLLLLLLAAFSLPLPSRRHQPWTWRCGEVWCDVK